MDKYSEVEALKKIIEKGGIVDSGSLMIHYDNSRTCLVIICKTTNVRIVLSTTKGYNLNVYEESKRVSLGEAMAAYLRGNEIISMQTLERYSKGTNSIDNLDMEHNITWIIIKKTIIAEEENV